MESCTVALAGLKLLGSGYLPASDSQLAGATGICHGSSLGLNEKRIEAKKYLFRQPLKSIKWEE